MERLALSVHLMRLNLPLMQLYRGERLTGIWRKPTVNNALRPFSISFEFARNSHGTTLFHHKSLTSQKTKLLRQAEHDLYQFFAFNDEETDLQRAQREVHWAKLCVEQAYAIPIQPTTRQLILPSVPSRESAKGPAQFGHARPGEGPVTPSPQKKLRVIEGNDSPSEPVPERKRLDPLPNFETRLRDTLEDYKQGRNVGLVPVYIAEQKELDVGIASNLSWLSSLEDQKTPEERKITQHGGIGRVGHTKEENEDLPCSRRRYSGDLVNLPDYPFSSWEEYTPRSDCLYNCFHQDTDCAFGMCRKNPHGCCVAGLDAYHFKQAFWKKKNTWRKQVKRLVSSGELGRRHLTWALVLKSKEGKKKKKKQSTKTKRAAQVLPATGVSRKDRTPRTQQAELLAQPPVPQVKEW